MTHYTIRIDVDGHPNPKQSIVAVAQTLAKYLNEDDAKDVSVGVTVMEHVGDQSLQLAEWNFPSEEVLWEQNCKEALLLRNSGDLRAAIQLVLYPPYHTNRSWDADTLDIIATLVETD